MKPSAPLEVLMGADSPEPGFNPPNEIHPSTETLHEEYEVPAKVNDGVSVTEAGTARSNGLLNTTVPPVIAAYAPGLEEKL
jgi:hypothetical protein